MSDNTTTIDDDINWFREASPYINAHRNKTMVLCLPTRLLDSELLSTLIHDLTLLSHLGLRLVVSFGLIHHTDSQLNDMNSNVTIIDGRRVTDDATIASVLTASGRTRTTLEAQLSMGLPNTPMAGARLSVCSGNYITAQPFGVHNGIDYRYTGTVRQVHTDAITNHLKSGHLVLLPPVGYSLTGDTFNLLSEEVAAATAVALGADKLVFFVDALPVDSDGDEVREASASDMEQLLTFQDDAALCRTLERAIAASRRGVKRIHLLNIQDSNALLRELFSRDGSGTLITAARWENIRAATAEDINGIIELITPLQANGTLANRSREQLERDINHFVVCDREGMIISCAALFLDALSHEDEQAPPTPLSAEIACVVTHPDYRGQGRAEDIIRHLETKARRLKVKQLILLTTRTAHWFIRLGYKEHSPESLPPSRQLSYNHQRRSKVFIKKL